MPRYMVSFERGGDFELEFDTNAPQTVAAFCKYTEENKEFPYSAKTLHGRFSGEEVFFKMPLREVERENFSIKPTQGVVSFNPDPAWCAICIYYGFRVPEKPRYQNQFGYLKGDMKQLEEVGLRIWQEGPEKTTIKVIE